MYDVMATNTSSGWNRPTGAAKPVAKKPSALRVVVAGLVVILLALAGAWYFLGDSLTSPAPKEKKTKTIKEVKGVKIEREASRDKSADAAKAAPLATKAADKVQAAAAATTNESAVAEVPKKPKRKPIFKNGTDQLIYLAVFASKGASIPPLPLMTRADTDKFIESLREPIEIDPKDPDHVKTMKNQVNEVRQQIAGLIAQEPDKELSQILNAHREDFNNTLNLRAEAQKAYDALVSEGDEEAAAEYRKKANEFLEQYGAEPIGLDDDAEEAPVE